MNLLHTKLHLRKIAGGDSLFEAQEKAAPPKNYGGLTARDTQNQAVQTQKLNKAYSFGLNSSAASLIPDTYGVGTTTKPSSTTAAAAIPKQPQPTTASAQSSQPTPAGNVNKQGGFQSWRRRRDAAQAERNSRIVNGRLQPTQAQRDLEARREEAQQTNAAYDAYVNSNDYKVEQRQKQQKAEAARNKAAVANPPKEMTTLPPSDIRKDYVYTATGDGPGKWAYKPKSQASAPQQNNQLPVGGSNTVMGTGDSSPVGYVPSGQRTVLNAADEGAQRNWFDSMKRQAQSGMVRGYGHMLDLDEANGFQGITNQDRWDKLTPAQKDELRGIWSGRKDQAYGATSMDDVKDAHMDSVTAPTGNWTKTMAEAKPTALDRQVKDITPKTFAGDVGSFVGDSSDPMYQERLKAAQMWGKAYPARKINEPAADWLKRLQDGMQETQPQPAQPRSWYNPMSWF